MVGHSAVNRVYIVGGQWVYWSGVRRVTITGNDGDDGNGSGTTRMGQTLCVETNSTCGKRIAIKSVGDCCDNVQ